MVEDRDAEFTAFMAAREHHLFRSAMLLTTDRSAAEDLLQTAMAKVYVAWRRVRSADEPIAYAHGVLYKTFLSDRRRRRAAEYPVSELPESPSAEPDPSDRLALLAALRLLSAKDRAVMVLRYWEDRSVAETAAALAMTESAVKNRSHRALKTLRAHLDDSTHDLEGAGDDRSRF